MADFQTNTELEALGIRVIAASVDTAHQAAELVSKMGLTTVEVASDLDGVVVAEALGAYLDTTNAPYLQPTAFIMNPNGEVVQSLYTSNALSRLSSADVVQMVKMYTNR